MPTHPLRRICCVEDDDDIRRIVRLSLEKIGKMTVDLRRAGLTNGSEQLFISSGENPPVDIPEPWTIGLFGAGLIGAGLLRRRKKA